MYFEILLPMSFSFSHAFDSSFPHIRQNGIRFKTPTSSFSCPVPSSFHNHMVGPSLGLHKTSIGDTLYYITSHHTSSTKKQNKCIYVWLTRMFEPLFKYPLTQDLKSRISWMSCGMNGQSWESINDFIKSPMTELFCFFKNFDKYPKLLSISSCF